MSTLRSTTRRAFTLIDTLMTVSVIGILYFAVAPNLSPDDPVRVLAAATMITADIEYAQSESLANPEDPTIVKFDNEGQYYWLAKASDSGAPINRPNSADPYIVRFGFGIAESLEGVSFATSDLNSNAVLFDAFGRLQQELSPTIYVGNETGNLAITIAVGTGSVSIAATDFEPEYEVPVEDEPEEEVEDDPVETEGGKGGGGLIGGLLGR